MLSLTTLLRKNLAIAVLGVAAVGGIGFGAGAIIGVAQGGPSGGDLSESSPSGNGLSESSPSGNGVSEGSPESGRAPIRNDQATQEEFEKQFEGRDSAKAKSIDELTPAERKELGLD